MWLRTFSVFQIDKQNGMIRNRKEELSAKGWTLFALAWKDSVLFCCAAAENLGDAILREGLLDALQGQELAEYYGTLKTAITVQYAC